MTCVAIPKAQTLYPNQDEIRSPKPETLFGAGWGGAGHYRRTNEAAGRVYFTLLGTGLSALELRVDFDE